MVGRSILLTLFVYLLFLKKKHSFFLQNTHEVLDEKNSINSFPAPCTVRARGLPRLVWMVSGLTPEVMFSFSLQSDFSFS